MRKLGLIVFGILMGFGAFAQDDDKPRVYTRPQNEYAQDTISTKSKVASLEPKKKFDWSKIIIEPNPQFAIYNGGIDIGLSALVGYNVWKGLFAGGGATYFYSGRTYLAEIPVSGGGTAEYKVTGKYHTYGGAAFLQYNIWRGFFARVKFEVLQRSITAPTGTYYISNNTPVFEYQKIQRTYPGLFIGAGYNMLQSKNFFLPIMISYNVLNSVGDKTYAPYRTGLNIQIGFINLF
ncbi:MAG: hypothetical protein U0T84_05035 [Chitinophagales bacterium]